MKNYLKLTIKDKNITLTEHEEKQFIKFCKKIENVTKLELVLILESIAKYLITANCNEELAVKLVDFFHQNGLVNKEG